MLVRRLVRSIRLNLRMYSKDRLSQQKGCGPLRVASFLTPIRSESRFAPFRARIGLNIYTQNVDPHHLPADLFTSQGVAKHGEIPAFQNEPSTSENTAIQKRGNGANRLSERIGVKTVGFPPHRSRCVDCRNCFKPNYRSLWAAEKFFGKSNFTNL